MWERAVYIHMHWTDWSRYTQNVICTVCTRPFYLSNIRLQVWIHTLVTFCTKDWYFSSPFSPLVNLS